MAIRILRIAPVLRLHSVRASPCLASLLQLHERGFLQRIASSKKKQTSLRSFALLRSKIKWGWTSPEAQIKKGKAEALPFSQGNLFHFFFFSFISLVMFFKDTFAKALALRCSFKMSLIATVGIGRPEAIKAIRIGITSVSLHFVQQRPLEIGKALCPSLYPFA